MAGRGGRRGLPGEEHRADLLERFGGPVERVGVVGDERGGVRPAGSGVAAVGDRVDRLEPLERDAGVAESGQVVQRPRGEGPRPARFGGVGRGDEQLARPGVLAPLGRDPRPAAVDLGIEDPHVGGRVGVDLREDAVGGVEMAEHRLRAGEGAEPPPGRRVPQLAPHHPRLPAPLGGGGRVTPVQVDAAQDRREPGLPVRRPDFDRAFVTEAGELHRLAHAAGLEQPLGLRDQVHAGAGELHVLADRAAGRHPGAGDRDRLASPTAQRECHRTGQRTLRVRQVGAVAEERLDEAERVVEAALEDEEDRPQRDEPVAQPGVGERDLGGLDDPLGVLHPSQPAEEVVGAGDRQVGPSPGRVRLGFSGAEHLLGLFVMPEPVESDPEHVRGVRAGTRGAGRVGEPHRELQVVGVVRLPRRGDEQLGVTAAPGVEAEHGDAQHVLASVGAVPLERVGEVAEDLPPAALGETGGDHLPVERVRHADLPSVRLDLDVEERPPFELVDAPSRDEVDQVVERHRLADGDELDDLTLLVREAPEAQPHHLSEARRRGQRAGQPPQPTEVPQGPGVTRTDDQLPEEERVAATGSPQRLRGDPVHRAAERGRDQLRAGSRVELGDVDAFEQLVLPECEHRLRCVGVHPDRHDEERQARLGEEVQQRRGGIVEQVGVVDDEEESPFADAVEDRVHGLLQRCGFALGAAERAGKIRRERAERDGSCRPVRADDRARPAPLLGQGDTLGRQAGLAHPGRSGEEDPAVTAVHRRGDIGELVGAAHERPGGRHDGVSVAPPRPDPGRPSRSDEAGDGTVKRARHPDGLSLVTHPSISAVWRLPEPGPGPARR